MNNNLIWIDHLRDFENNRNSTYNPAIKATPDQLWEPNKDKVEMVRILPNKYYESINDRKKIARAEAVRRTKRIIQKFRDQDKYEVGDLVRVKMSTIFSGIRQLIKSGNSKQIVVEYTPDTFVIDKVIYPRNLQISRHRYVLRNADGQLRETLWEVTRFC